MTFGPAINAPSVPSMYDIPEHHDEAVESMMKNPGMSYERAMSDVTRAERVNEYMRRTGCRRKYAELVIGVSR